MALVVIVTFQQVEMYGGSGSDWVRWQVIHCAGFGIITSWRDGEDDDGDDDDDVSKDDVNTDSDDDDDGDDGDDGDGDRSFTVLGSHCHQVWANHLLPRENMLR